MTIGEKLKIAREEKNITLKQVQENIKIRTRYLEAIEKNNYDIIPGEAYVKAFIKSYANYLGLDYNELIKQYEEIKAEERKKIEELQEDEEENNKSTTNLIHNKTFISSIIIAVILVVLVFLIYNVFLLNDSKNDISRVSTDASLQMVTDDTNKKDNIKNNLINQEASANTGIDSEPPQNAFIQNQYDNKNSDATTDSKMKNDIEDDSEKSIENKQKQKLDIIVVEKSWVQIIIDGDIVYEGILDKGDNMSYTYSENVSMKIGNGSGIKVRKGNRILGPWGGKGEVIQKTIEG